MVFESYLKEIYRANEIIGSVPLDAEPLWWPAESFGDWRIESLREMFSHVVVETAGHAGQLDVVRELLDGKQWLVLTKADERVGWMPQYTGWDGIPLDVAPFAVEVQRWSQLIQAAALSYSSGVTTAGVTSRPRAATNLAMSL